MTEQAKQTISEERIAEQIALMRKEPWKLCAQDWIVLQRFIESALTALQEERAQLKHENQRLLTRRDSEGDSPRQPAAPTDTGLPSNTGIVDINTGI